MVRCETRQKCNVWKEIKMSWEAEDEMLWEKWGSNILAEKETKMSRMKGDKNAICKKGNITLKGWKR